MMTIIEKLYIRMLEREYQVHVYRYGKIWKVELPDRTIKTLTLAEMEAQLEADAEARI